MSQRFQYKDFHKLFKKCIQAKTQEEEIELIFGADCNHIYTNSSDASKYLSGKKRIPAPWVKKILFEGVDHITARFEKNTYVDKNNHLNLVSEVIVSVLDQLDIDRSSYNFNGLPESFREDQPVRQMSELFFLSIINEANVKNQEPEHFASSDKTEAVSANPVNNDFVKEDDSVSFLKVCLEHGEIAEVRMAFHTGWYWGIDSEKIGLLQYFYERDIPVKVLVNSSDTIEDICSGMRSMFKNYNDINKEVEAWHIRSQYFTNIELKICTEPILRRYQWVKFKDGSEVCSIRPYIYFDSSTVIKTIKHILHEKDPNFDHYKDEFEYLWKGVKKGANISIPYSSFKNQLVKNCDCKSLFDFVTQYDINEIKELTLMFHSGFSWFMPDNRYAYLKQCHDLGIRLNVIINDTESVEHIFRKSHLAGSLGKYPNHDYVLESWKETAEKFAINLKSFDAVLFHSVCFLTLKDGDSFMCVNEYMYGSDLPKEDHPIYIYNRNDEDFALYEEEIKYISEHSVCLYEPKD